MKVYLGTPVYRGMQLAFHNCILKLEKRVAQSKMELVYGYVDDDPDISRARNVAASAFLKSDCDVLLSIDSDIWFRPGDAMSLCRKAESWDIMGGLYMVRSLKNKQPAPLIGIGQSITLAPGEEPIEVQFLATGFMAVHRRVFEKLAETLPLCQQSTPLPFWPFYMPFSIPWPGEGHLYLSEDYAFCQRAREAGFKIWLDPSIRLGHIGQREYRLEDLVTNFPPPMPMRLTQEEGGIKSEVLEVMQKK